MKKSKLTNLVYIGARGKESNYDLEIVNPETKSCVVFMHGYMGFKDWGCWNLVQEYFVEHEANFAKFNVSHNGTSLTNQTQFVDLESFGHNSYWNELTDLLSFLDHLEEAHGLNQIHLIGHSRGGGMVLLGAKHKNVKSVTTWAAISSIEKRMPQGEKLASWKSEQVYFVKNGRTEQEMPHYFFQYNDFIEHKSELNITEACENLDKPLCIIHGTNDDSVNISESEEIELITHAEFHRIDGSNHTFDSKHPWENIYLPENLLKVCDITRLFIENQNTL